MAAILENILLVVSVLLIAIVLLQGNKATDSAGIITGGSQELFQNMKERGFELFITRATYVLGILFFLIKFIIFMI